VSEEPVYLPVADMPDVMVDFQVELEAEGFPQTDIQRIQEAQMRAYGGRAIYYPQQQYQVNKRNSEIMKEFNGRNAAEICVKYEITRRRFYQILRLYIQRKRSRK
jgi:Mor family transcriptional regulator